MEIEQIVKESRSYSEVARKLKITPNGKGLKKTRSLIGDISTTHFLPKGNRRGIRKYEVVTKNCPVCNAPFQTLLGSPKEKVACGYSCSNRLTNRGNCNREDKLTYRTICFRHHEKKCAVCSEVNLIEVHHYDGNHSNNVAKNLVPLCPTHHQYCPSRYKKLIQGKIDEYVTNFNRTVGP
jgi:hypothetical protein